MGGVVSKRINCPLSGIYYLSNESLKCSYSRIDLAIMLSKFNVYLISSLDITCHLGSGVTTVSLNGALKLG